jgi:hypothetical protein
MTAKKTVGVVFKEILILSQSCLYSIKLTITHKQKELHVHSMGINTMWCGTSLTFVSNKCTLHLSIAAFCLSCFKCCLSVYLSVMWNRFFCLPWILYKTFIYFSAFVIQTSIVSQKTTLTLLYKWKWENLKRIQNKVKRQSQSQSGHWPN